MESSANGEDEPTHEDRDAGEPAETPQADSAQTETGKADPTDHELAELRAAVEEKYDFENFGPADMAEMSADEWEAAFDHDTWITGPELLDRIEADLKGKIASRQVFAMLERSPEQLLVYSDVGYAVISPDGTVEGEGSLRREIEPIVAMCSMEEYEIEEPPEEYELPEPEAVAEQTGEFGNLMLQLIAGMQLVGGLALLLAFVLGFVSTLAAPAIGGLFVIVGGFLFLLVANARLSDRFRAEQYRNRLRALDTEGIQRPELAGESDVESGSEPAPKKSK